LSNRTLTQTTQPSALHLLHRAGQYADELFVSNVGNNAITPRQFEVLSAVRSSKDPSQTALVKKTGIDRSTLADIVRRLVDRGLLMRKRTPRDTRKYAVSLTEAGDMALSQIEPAVVSTNMSLLATLQTEERKVFLSILERIVDSVKPATEN